MTSFRQIEANRRNAQLSTGPVTEMGKRKSRQNAIRHGLTAETVIGALEDAEDYAAFEMAVTADYDAQTAVERELVLRLASLLWRLRRATAIESGLFEIQALHLLQFRQGQRPQQVHQQIIGSEHPYTIIPKDDMRQHETKLSVTLNNGSPATSEQSEPTDQSDDLTGSFVRLANQPTYPLDRLSRYEATLWRQARQVLVTLRLADNRKPWERLRLR